MGVSTDAVFGWGLAFDEEWPHDDEERESLEAAIAPFGVVFDVHCSSSCPMPLLFIRESTLKAWRGHPKVISPREPGADWNERVTYALMAARAAVPGLAAFLKELKPPEPGWWVVSFWEV